MKRRRALLLLVLAAFLPAAQDIATWSKVVKTGNIKIN